MCQRVLNNGLPQEPVLAPFIFDIYMADMPDTVSEKFQNADDTALVIQAPLFGKLENTLNAYLLTLEREFKSWRFKPNPNQSVSTCFLLNSWQALMPVQFSKFLVYLGETLDRALTFKTHN